MTAIAVSVGAGSGLAGVLISNSYDVAAGGAITVVTGVTFALSLTATATWHALTARLRNKSGPATQTRPDQSQATGGDRGPFPAATN
jgi:hypothetical protein